jgi:hypothetical protein
VPDMPPFEKCCFVIAPIGDEGTPTRKRSDDVLDLIIEPAAKECGMEAIRSDKISEPGVISAQVIQAVAESAMVVADLTDANANVHYELAVRHLLRKPYAHIIEIGQRAPFDVDPVRRIEIESTNPRSVDNARQQLAETIRSAIHSGEVDSPISVAFDLQRLRSSSDPEKRRTAELLEAVMAIRQDLDGLQATLRAALEGKTHVHEEELDVQEIRRVQSIQNKLRRRESLVRDLRELECRQVDQTAEGAGVGRPDHMQDRLAEEIEEKRRELEVVDGDILELEAEARRRTTDRRW